MRQAIRTLDKHRLLLVRTIRPSSLPDRTLHFCRIRCDPASSFPAHARGPALSRQRRDGANAGSGDRRAPEVWHEPTCECLWRGLQARPRGASRVRGPRADVARFLGAVSPQEVVLTYGTTSSLIFLAQSFGERLRGRETRSSSPFSSITATLCHGAHSHGAGERTSASCR